MFPGWRLAAGLAGARTATDTAASAAGSADAINYNALHAGTSGFADTVNNFDAAQDKLFFNSLYR